jgi:hypothetical protein
MISCLALLAMLAGGSTACAQTVRAPAFLLADSVIIDIDPGKTGPTIRKQAGEAVPFTLTAKYPSGVVLRAWGGSGDTAILTLRDCTANSDTCQRAYCSDASAYSWAELRIASAGGILARQTAPHEWRIPASVFIDGALLVEVASSKAERGLYLEARTVRGKTVSQSSSIEYSVVMIAGLQPAPPSSAEAVCACAAQQLRPKAHPPCRS